MPTIRDTWLKEKFVWPSLVKFPSKFSGNFNTPSRKASQVNVCVLATALRRISPADIYIKYPWASGWDTLSFNALPVLTHLHQNQMIWTTAQKDVAYKNRKSPKWVEAGVEWWVPHNFHPGHWRSHLVWSQTSPTPNRMVFEFNQSRPCASEWDMRGVRKSVGIWRWDDNGLRY